MDITHRTHFNPCFWTAFWNKDYYEKYQKNPSIKKDCRKQIVYSLNLRAGNILKSKIENVHFEKGLGTSEITPDKARDYCKRVFPEKYDELDKYLKSHPDTLILDFENVFSAIENSPAYQSLIDVIQKEKISMREEKANIATFIVLHNMRNHSIINSMIEISDKLGEHNFEHFIWLKHAWSNPGVLYHLVYPLIESQWILYKTKDHTFPLCDSPIMSKNGSIMVALSPRMLLEINMRTKTDLEKWAEKDYIPKFKLNEFRRRTISHSFVEIVFNERETLEVWQRTKEYKRRVRLLSNLDSYNVLIKKEGDKEIWKINAFAGTN